jgi:hypothetical protein
MSHDRRTPRTPEEMAELLRTQPSGWEYLLYAGVLLEGRQALEDKYRDHDVGFAPTGGPHVDEHGAIKRLQEAFREAEGFGTRVERLLDPTAQERAFGAPGEPGDTERIKHLGRRLVDVYESMLDWAADLRTVHVPEEFRHAFELAARMIDQPLKEFRDFIDRLVSVMDGLAAQLAEPDTEPIEIELELRLSIDECVAGAFHTELERLQEIY